MGKAASVVGLAAYFVILAAASGCGSGTMAVAPITPSLAIQADARAADKGIKVAVEEFATARDNNKKFVVGEAKTGVFNALTNMVAKETPEQTVAGALREALAKTGFQVVEPKDADFVIGGRVQDFWVGEYATGVSLEYAKAYVRFDLTVKNVKGNIVWGDTLEKYETSAQCWDATAQDIPTLTKALQDTVVAVLANDGFWKVLSK